jgi:hypothetical protein
MEIILKYNGESAMSVPATVATLGQANVYIFQNGHMPDNDEVDRNAKGMHEYMLKKMLAKAHYSPRFEELEYVESEITGMLSDYMMTCQDTGRMYVINNILENQDFTVEFE